jgi:hypothetical protein
MALTDLTLKRALPGPKIIKLSDGGGLQLWVTPDGAKRWRLAYRFGGAQKTLAIGVYPEVGLRDARDARDGARQALGRGEDPSQIKKAAKGAKAEATANIIRSRQLPANWRKRSVATGRRLRLCESSNGL